MGHKNAEFDADFEFVKKLTPKRYRKMKLLTFLKEN